MANPRWTVGDVSGSDTLSSDDHLHESHINEIRQAIDDRAISAKDYEATGDGVTDDTTALQNLLSDGAGKTIVIEEGDYLISDTLTIEEDTTVIAYGARIFDTTTHRNLVYLDAGGIRIFGLELEGAGNTSYDTDGLGIHYSGDVNNYIENIKIVDCYLHDLGKSAIWLEYVKNVVIDSCRVYDVAYSGMTFWPGTNCRVQNCHIKGVEPGAGGTGYNNAYGIAFTRKETSDDLSLYPRSKDCSAIGNLIEDVPSWTALDTHAGENIHFIGNVTRNTRTGVSLGITNPGDVPDHAAQNCKVIGNTIIGADDGDGTAGIRASGAIGSGVGDVLEYSTGHVISGNTLIECGDPGISTIGAINLYRTKGVSVTGNTIKDCVGMAGILLGSDNSGFSITGNTVIDQNDASLSGVSGIKIDSTYNKGFIGGNTLLLINDSLDTYVMEQGIRIDDSTNNEISIGNNYNNCETEFSGSGTSGQNTFYGHFADGVKVYVGSGTPESSITAEVGSLYINTSGGSGTTLYVKESGSSNTGWAAV